MNRLKLIMATIVITLTSFYSFAGFIDTDTSKKTDDINVINVNDISFLQEGKDVCLEGSISRKIDKDYYMFKDNTGEIKVKIANSVWGKINATPDHTVRITGRVYNNSSLNRQRHIPAQIKVKKIEILQTYKSIPRDS